MTLKVKPKYTVYAVDRAGVPWDVLHTDSPREAVDCAEAQRALHGRERTLGIYEPDDPEKGDVEMELEEMLWEEEHGEEL